MRVQTMLHHHRDLWLGLGWEHSEVGHNWQAARLFQLRRTRLASPPAPTRWTTTHYYTTSCHLPRRSLEDLQIGKESKKEAMTFNTRETSTTNTHTHTKTTTTLTKKKQTKHQPGDEKDREREQAEFGRGNGAFVKQSAEAPCDLHNLTLFYTLPSACLPQ
mmetsp:Transcript_25247/g.53646  ORF Transcript_25247/g.53646 Transcript_25247/m.53646 type:complete len:161 (-) Transcript_25247:157-639(-)